MLNYTTLRDYYKSVDTLQSNYLITAEWNMNKYKPIEKYGIYTKRSLFPTTYDPDDVRIKTGENYLIYDDGTKKNHPDQTYFSTLSSIFKPNRPDPGIILTQKFGNMTLCSKFSNMKTKKMATNNPRYYPFSENRTYDYFNSAKIFDLTNNSQDKLYAAAHYGISNPQNGEIGSANPFVVYDEEFPANKLRIKVQTHLAVPDQFSVEVLIDNEWVMAYAPGQSSSEDFATGTLDLYYQKQNGVDTWTKEIYRVDDINELANPVSQVQKIRGIRFVTYKMTLVDGRNNTKSSASLEMIEMSPRLEMDLSEYTQSFNFDSSIGDTTGFGLPVGSIVSSTGQISIYNEDNQFFLASTLSSLKMLNQDTKFTFYQKVFLPDDGETYNVPLKVLYSNKWDVGEDYSVAVSLEDGFKFLRQLNAPDLMFAGYVPLSVAILIILDNVGVTGLEFKKSSNAPQYDKEDVAIKNFFCKKEQTVAEVFEQLALGTQCSMFYDAVGNLNVLTKEKLTESVSPEESDGTGSSKTDFWFVADENYTSDDPESQYLTGYTANVASINEDKINPLTDGTITYHMYGPQKSALASLLSSKKKKDILDKLNQDEFPMNTLANADYGYATTILWQPASDNSSVLGAANISKDLKHFRLKNIFTASYTAFDEDDAVRTMYESINNVLEFPTDTERDRARQSLIIYLDANEGLTLPAYDGMVMIDNEYIAYHGKLFYIAAPNDSVTGEKKSGFQVIFSEDQLNQIKADINTGSTIVFKGLVVDVTFKLIGKDKDKYIYKVIGDGRGRRGSNVITHYSVAEESDGIDPTKTFGIMLGEKKNFKMPGELSSTTKFNFMEQISYKSVKNALGNLPKESLETYLGFLKINGPQSPKSDRKIMQSIISSASSASADANLTDLQKELDDINKQVDEDVPGNFDDYVYMKGEKSIYGQKIDLGFVPNTISTRMRLYSPRKRISDKLQTMDTNSSIAGIGFGINENNEGYFLEVESAGAGKDFSESSKEAFLNNLRFYKVFLNKHGKYEPKLLLKGSVGAMTMYDTAINIIKSDSITTDPVFELEIQIKEYKNAMVYTIKYGDTPIASYTEPADQNVGVKSDTIFLFVRNDSSAIYEYVAAAARPKGKVNSHYFDTAKSMHKQIENGIIPVNTSFMFKDDNIQFYFNDFARLAREVKEIEVRFSTPAFVSTLLDISKINPQYLVKKYSSTGFGAKLTILNTSGQAITLSTENNLPLYIVGIALQELNSGTVSMKDTYNVIEDDSRRATQRELNAAIYGQQTFSLDNQYIQSQSQARNLMKWIIKHCNRQRIKFSLQIFPNPLLELGDKVKIFDKSRDYNQANPYFGQKTFVISAISNSVDSNGPSMNVSLVEVGESDGAN